MINGKVVAIDARMINMSGIGTYIQHLMGQEIYDYAYGNEREIRIYDEEIKVIPYNAPIYGIKEQIDFPNKQTREENIELVHFPHYNVPISYRGQYVVTVHDLIHIIHPEFLGTKIKYYYAKFLMKHAVKNAKHIFTVSEHSKKDICNYFDVEQGRISISYPAVDGMFTQRKPEDNKYLYDKYSIPHNKKLLLYVGNLKPHKNILGLLKALSKIENKNNYILLLVGKAFKNHLLDESEKKLGISDLVIHTGIVDKKELIDLYNLADLFVFPSFYEGFGLPPLEAMACATPVIASNCSSIPEVVGDAAILFDPNDDNDIKDKIELVLGDQRLQNEMIGKGMERVKLFTWDKTVEIVRKKLCEVLERE